MKMYLISGTYLEDPERFVRGRKLQKVPDPICENKVSLIVDKIFILNLFISTYRTALFRIGRIRVRN